MIFRLHLSLSLQFWHCWLVWIFFFRFHITVHFWLLSYFSGCTSFLYAFSLPTSYTALCSLPPLSLSCVFTLDECLLLHLYQFSLKVLRFFFQSSGLTSRCKRLLVSICTLHPTGISHQTFSTLDLFTTSMNIFLYWYLALKAMYLLKLNTWGSPRPLIS